MVALRWHRLGEAHISSIVGDIRSTTQIGKVRTAQERRWVGCFDKGFFGDILACLLLSRALESMKVSLLAN